MEKYKVYSFCIAPMSDDAADMLTALLADAGFDSFQQTDTGVDAYIPADSDMGGTDIDALVAAFPLPVTAITYTVSELEQRNWNEEWENTGFRPIVVPGLCAIHTPLQAVAPQPYDIVIQPRMAFGSGTHATTAQLVELLLGMELKGLSTLDMGCGTGILAICMALRGASRVVAVDIDEASVENTRLNAQLNGLEHIEVVHGDATVLRSRFHLIVANIHRNIIIHDLPTYVRHLHRGGKLVVSGFFTADIPAVRTAAEMQGLQLTAAQERDGWAVLSLTAG